MRDFPFRACGANAAPEPVPDAPLRRHHLRQRLPAVPGAAGHREADPAVVRRLGGGLDHVPRLLSDGAARGLCVRRLRRAPARRARAGEVAHAAARRVRRAASDRSRRLLEADRRRESVVADPGPARGDHRAAVLPAVDDEPAGPGLVRARAARREPVPAVRAVESRVDAGARRLPVPVRAVDADALAGDRLVGRPTRSSSVSARPPAGRA